MPSLDYQRVNWEDAPSRNTPISAENLGNMDNGLASLYRDVAVIEDEIENIDRADGTDLAVTFAEEGDPGADEAPLQPSPSTLGDIITGIHSRIRALTSTLTDFLENKIINNYTTTQEGRVLDARAGKTLAESVAPVEDGATVSANYAVGTHFYHDNKLYKTTEAIQQGDAIVTPDDAAQALIDDPGSELTANVEESTLSEDVEDTNDLFLIKRYEASYSVNANTYKVIYGNDANYTALPSGYTAVAMRTIDTNSNDVVARYVNVGGYGTRTLYVLRNITSSAKSGTCTIEILFVKDSYIGN